MADQFYIAANRETWEALTELAAQTGSYPQRGPKAGTSEPSVMTLVRRIAADDRCLDAIREILAESA